MAILFPPKYALVQISKWFKGTSARKILSEFPHIKKRYFWGSGFWGGQHFFDSLGGTTRNLTQNYVREQKGSFRPQRSDENLNICLLRCRGIFLYIKRSEGLHFNSFLYRAYASQYLFRMLVVIVHVTGYDNN